MPYPIPSHIQEFMANVPAKQQLSYLTEPTGKCVRMNTAGGVYEEFACLYPAIGATYMDWEFQYDVRIMRDWLRDNFDWYVPVFSFLYLAVLVYGGQKYFETRPAWNCRKAWAIWNFVLSIFSLIGFIRTLPVLIHHLLTNESWTDFFCIDPETNVGSGTTGVWSQFWVLSKLPEFLDTFFLVVHKKPVIFLHWFHHVVTFAGTALGYKSHYNGFIYVVMNYGVHAIMYYYYGVMALKCRPAWLNPFYITIAQILQMATALVYVAAAVYVAAWLQPEQCGASTVYTPFILGCVVVFGAFLVLFLQVFFGRYMIQVWGKKSDKHRHHGAKGKHRNDKINTKKGILSKKNAIVNSKLE